MQDESFTYSGAIYKDQNSDLEAAQKNKFQKLINLIDIKDGNKVLEIGCGWGGFAEYLAKKYDVSLDCITISKNQFEFTKRRIFKLPRCIKAIKGALKHHNTPDIEKGAFFLHHFL